jgi:hypothetical protein
MDQMRLQMELMMREKEEMVRTHSIEAGELRKKVTSSATMSGPWAQPCPRPMA